MAILAQERPAPEREVEAAPGRWALGSLSLTMLLSALGTSSANVALPTLARMFDATFGQVQWVVIAYLLTVTALIVGVGRLGDVAGPKRLLLAGLMLFTLASAVCALAPSLWVLVAARAMQGLGAAAMMALTMALVADAVPGPRIGRAMGVLGASSALGTALGPSLGGVLIAGPGWRAIFLVNVPLGIAAFLLAGRHLPAPRPAHAAARVRLDIRGTVLLAFTLSSYALAMTTGRGQFGPLNLALGLAAAAGTLLFLRAETRAASPLIEPGMFRDPVMAAGLGASALVSTVMMATLIVGPFYLSRGLGLDAVQVGLLMSVGPVVVALAGVPAGRVADRFGAYRATIAGLLGLAAGSFLLAALPLAFGVAGYVAPIVLVTASYALFQTANNAAVMAGAGPERRGVVSGLLNLSRNLGLVTGATAMGAVFAWAAATPEIASADPPAASAGMRATFLAAGVLILPALAILAAVRRGKRAAAR